jgi:hypothetical protein
VYPVISANNIAASCRMVQFKEKWQVDRVDIVDRVVGLTKLIS